MFLYVPLNLQTYGTWVGIPNLLLLVARRYSVMPVTVARLNISARHIRVIVPALSPAPRDALTESPIPLRRGLFRLT